MRLAFDIRLSSWPPIRVSIRLSIRLSIRPPRLKLIAFKSLSSFILALPIKPEASPPCNDPNPAKLPLSPESPPRAAKLRLRFPLPPPRSDVFRWLAKLPPPPPPLPIDCARLFKLLARLPMPPPAMDVIEPAPLFPPIPVASEPRPPPNWLPPNPPARPPKTDKTNSLRSTLSATCKTFQLMQIVQFLITHINDLVKCRYY